MASFLPALTCDGVGTGWTAYGYKMAAEVIFSSFLWNAVQWFLEYAYSGVAFTKKLVAPAVEAYETICSTSVESGFLSWSRQSSWSNQACLDAALFKEKAIYNANQALIEAREWISNIFWGSIGGTGIAGGISGAVDAKSGDFTRTTAIASALFNSRHVLVCKIAAALEQAFQSSSSCSRKRRRVDKPELKL